ncbi:MAG: ATP-binding cassette domain-containing protein [Gammaproteobacteria bacterium]|nr:MAG: ATP-binding cassette domain-containing protein [Gammaproteobacteria bacterium]
MGMALSLQRGKISYGDTVVLQEIDLSIAQGERVAIIGASGSGKSTLLEQLYQQAPAQCAWCPQDPALIGNLSVFHNIYMGRLSHHRWPYNTLNLLHPLARERDAAQHWIDALELPAATTRADSLSGGQKQRVGIARALHQQAPVLLADEPVSAVDDWQADRILSLLVQHSDTLVLALHDIGQALRYCQRIIALKDTRIVLDAPCHTLSTDALQWVYD